MPKYIPSMPFEDCYGSVGDLTFYHRNGQCYYRKRASPEFAGTMLQMEYQTVHLRALEAWRQLTPDLQKQWNEYSVGVQSHRPPFDGKSGITGHNLFVSAYHGFAKLGREHTPSPQPWVEFPPYAVEGVASAVVEGEDLRLGIRVFLDERAPSGRYHLLVRLMLARAGGGFRPGLLRSYLAEPALSAGEGVATFVVPDFRSVWDLGLDGYTAHCRCCLLDGQLGYRTAYRRVSFDFIL